MAKRTIGWPSRRAVNQQSWACLLVIALMVTCVSNVVAFTGQTRLTSHPKSLIATWQSRRAGTAGTTTRDSSTGTQLNFASYPNALTLASRPSSSQFPRFMVSYEELMEKLPSQPVIQAIERQPQKTRVVAADVAAAAGVSLEQAKQDLTALASISQGDIAVSADGELLYSFPDNLSSVLSQNSLRYQSLQTFQKAWPFLFWLVRISFGVTLVASVVAIFSTIFFISASSSSSNDDRDDRRSGGGGMGGGGMGGNINYFFGPSPLDFFYYRPYGYYGYYGTPQNERRQSDDMGFLESIFSYIFGDGNPNANLSEKRLALVANLIRQNQGSVTAEQLAPFCDATETPSAVQDKTYVDESFVLPVVTALNGEPRVTEDGDIVYVFPELQTSATGNALAPTTSSDGMTLRRAGLVESSSNRDIKRFLEYNGIATRGVLERGDLISILEKALPPMTEEEEAELLDSDPTVLQEREYKFSVASDLNKVLAGGLGVVNLGGALYLGNMFSQLAPLGRLPGWYGAVQTFYPALLGYAIFYNVIPLVRNFWIKRQNEKIRQRNKIRKDWKAALASSIRNNSAVQRKLAAAKRMGTKLKQVGASPNDIVFDTKQSIEDVKEIKGKSDLDDFDKLLEAKDKGSLPPFS